MRGLTRPRISGIRGIHFGTVTPPNVGQRPTFGLESSLLWETSMLTVAQSAFRPTTVPKWIPLLPVMSGLEGRCSSGCFRFSGEFLRLFVGSEGDCVVDGGSDSAYCGPAVASSLGDGRSSSGLVC